MNRKLTLLDRQHIAFIGSQAENILDAHILLDDYISSMIEEISHREFIHNEHIRITRKLRKKKYTAEEIENTALEVVYKVSHYLCSSNQVRLQEAGVI